MSRVTIKSNVNALMVNRQLASTTRALQETFARLSSGLRINKASDDAAGLAIAEALKADRRVFTQGIRNLNDGISLLNIADSAVTELTSIVARIRELAAQSGNGTLNLAQRKAIDTEAQELAKEFNRIARSTEFNGAALFDADFGTLSLQAGYGEYGRIASGLGGNIGDGSFTLGNTITFGDAVDITTGDFNGDGILDLVGADYAQNTISVYLGTGGGSFAAAVSYSVGAGVNPLHLNTSDLNGDGSLDIMVAGQSSGDVFLFFGNGAGSFSGPSQVNFGAVSQFREVLAEDFNNDGIMDIATTEAIDDTVRIALGTGGGSFGPVSSYSLGAGVLPRSMTVGDFNGDGVMDLATAENGPVDGVSVLLGVGDGTFGSPNRINLGAGVEPEEIITADFNGDGKLDLATANLGDDTLSVFFGFGDGTFASATNLSLTPGDDPRGIAAGDFNGDGNIDLVSAEYADTISIFLGNGDGSFSSRATYSVGGTNPNPLEIALGDFNRDGVLDIATANNVDNTAGILLGDTTQGISALLPFSLRHQFEALQAVPMLDRTLELMSAQRGVIGAFQSRVEIGTRHLMSTVENLAAAESRITDVDVAKEAAELIRLSILQQAGIAVLGQANNSPALALRLLEDS